MITNTVRNIQLVLSSWEVLLDFAINLIEFRKTTTFHPNDEILLFHVNPLLLFPIGSIFEFIAFITRPCDSTFGHLYFYVIFVQFKSVCEIAVSNQPTWWSNISFIKSASIHWFSFPHFFVSYNRGTELFGFFHFQFKPSQLWVTFTLYVSSVVLVKIGQSI